ncbi:MAG TPA: TonB-dependent receptor [Blastocatellia bacterium]|nr:TonB-dependent receptor [Blastocatellia bacterium]
MNNYYRTIAIASLLSLLLSLAAYAQGNSGTIRGNVTDESGAAINQARVRLRTINDFTLRETSTNERGEFSFDNIALGDYKISIEAEGLTQTGGAQTISVTGGQNASVTIKLSVAAINDAVIVSATRTETNVTAVPSSTYVVSANDLARSQRVNVFDALRLSPGVTVMQTARRGGVTSLFIRGGESDYTKVLIDGVPANDAGGAFDFSDLTTDNAERVELVRGSQSSLYGSDAMSGVLQLVTRRGTSSTPEFEFTGEGGSFGFNRQLARLSGANSGFDYSLSFSRLRTNGRDRNDDYQNRTASANLGYRFREQTALRVTLRNENSGAGVPGATARFFPDPDERVRRRRIATGARLDDQTTQFWHQQFAFTYSENNQESFDPVGQDLTKPNTPPDTFFAFNDFSFYFKNHQRRRGLRYQSDLVLPHNNLLSAGVDWEQERAVFDSGFSGTSRVAANRTNTGFFLQNQFALSDRFVLNAGLRVENNRAQVPSSLSAILASLGSAPVTGEVGFGTVVVPKVAFAFTLQRGNENFGATRVRASYGEGIKEPTMVEAFSPSPFFLGNPTLKPERARSFDFGIEQLLVRDRVRIEATYFENRYRNQIAFVGDPSTFGGPIRTPQGLLTNNINNDRARARGLEFAVAVRPIRQLSLSGQYTLVASKITAIADVIDFVTLKLVPSDELGLSLVRRPKHFGSINIAWTGEKFDINLDGFFVGRRRDIDPVTFSRLVYNDAYAKLDLAGGYRITPRVMAFARIENLLNRDYQEVLGYPAYRLNFSAGMRFRIGGDN